MIWFWFDRHRYVNDPCKKVEKNIIFFKKKFKFFFRKYSSNVIYYRNTVVILSYSHYRFHYWNSIATLEGLQLLLALVAANIEKSILKIFLTTTPSLTLSYKIIHFNLSHSGLFETGPKDVCCFIELDIFLSSWMTF